MLKIALTGGIGSGKSTVAKLFADLGAPVIDADQIAHEIAVPGTLTLQTIAQHFGQSVLQKDGTLNRTKLADVVFQNKSERLWLEQLLHPVIQKEMLKKLIKINAPYCILVIPLLVETKNVHFHDRVLVVDAPENLQIERVQSRNKLSLEQIKAILQSQASRDERLAMADDMIKNDASLEVLAKAVKALHEKYLTLK